MGLFTTWSRLPSRWPVYSLKWLPTLGQDPVKEMGRVRRRTHNVPFWPLPMHMHSHRYTGMHVHHKHTHTHTHTHTHARTHTHTINRYVLKNKMSWVSNVRNFGFLLFSGIYQSNNDEIEIKLLPFRGKRHI
jgi:ABC-type nickel/cobalt efflux system permease component RcnA